MNSPDYQIMGIDWLLVGLRGVPVELVVALNLCRHYDGSVVFREKDVLVIEFGSYPQTIEELLGKLPRGAVTHVWRSGLQKTSRVVNGSEGVTPFCGIQT